MAKNSLGHSDGSISLYGKTRKTWRWTKLKNINYFHFRNWGPDAALNLYDLNLASRGSHRGLEAEKRLILFLKPVLYNCSVQYRCTSFGGWKRWDISDKKSHNSTLCNCRPMRGQYLDHMISLDQSEDRLTRPFVIINNPGEVQGRGLHNSLHSSSGVIHGALGILLGPGRVHSRMVITAN